MHRLVLLALLFAGLLFGADPASVMIIVNDAVPSEAGTRERPASVWVGEQYAALRGIPAENILHTASPMACCTFSPHSWDSWNISFERFDAEIRQPVLAFLAGHPEIHYIVPTYGVPVRVSDRQGGLAIDSYLNNPTEAGIFQFNPYLAPIGGLSPPLEEFPQPGDRVYAVSRLDGPSAVASVELVRRAMRAETVGLPANCVGYFDSRQGWTDHANASVARARDAVAAHDIEVIFNENQGTATMIKNAPLACFAWGWYSGNTSWPGYEFVEGAVGSQLTSFTAVRIRSGLADNTRGAWVARWLAQDSPITVTWGATTEPFTSGYAKGDVVFEAMLAGRTFGEALLMATPRLNWAMIGVGDPLYQMYLSGGCVCNCGGDPTPPPAGENSIQILSPLANQIFQQGDEITFNVVAQDRQGVDMCGRVFWSSNLTGGIGTGCTVKTTGMTPGTHQVRGSFVNNEGERTSEWVTITVLAAP
jgi:uncharacterized protein (TIGR03790 family)